MKVPYTVVRAKYTYYIENGPDDNWSGRVTRVVELRSTGEPVRFYATQIGVSERALSLPYMEGLEMNVVDRGRGAVPFLPTMLEVRQKKFVLIFTPPLEEETVTIEINYRWPGMWNELKTERQEHIKWEFITSEPADVFEAEIYWDSQLDCDLEFVPNRHTSADTAIEKIFERGWKFSVRNVPPHATAFEGTLKVKDKRGIIVPAPAQLEPAKPRSMAKLKWMGILVAILTALIAAAAKVWVAYIPKPNEVRPELRPELRVVVSTSSNSPVSGAKVVLESNKGRREQKADALGQTVFGLELGESKLEATASGPGNEKKTIGCRAGEPCRVIFDEQDTPRAARKSGERTRTRPLERGNAENASTITGVWTVLVAGDPENAKVREGTVEFGRTPADVFKTTGNFLLGGDETTILGDAKQIGSTVRLTFDGKRKDGSTWSGKGDLLMIGEDRLEGSIDVPNEARQVAITLKRRR